MTIRVTFFSWSLVCNLGALVMHGACYSYLHFYHPPFFLFVKFKNLLLIYPHSFKVFLPIVLKHGLVINSFDVLDHLLNQCNNN